MQFIAVIVAVTIASVTGRLTGGTRNLQVARPELGCADIMLKGECNMSPLSCIWTNKKCFAQDDDGGMVVDPVIICEDIARKGACLASEAGCMWKRSSGCHTVLDVIVDPIDRPELACNERSSETQCSDGTLGCIWTQNSCFAPDEDGGMVVDPIIDPIVVDPVEECANFNTKGSCNGSTAGCKWIRKSKTCRAVDGDM